jgi:Helix-turn-helix of DDE superfamily endonuclease
VDPPYLGISSSCSGGCVLLARRTDVATRSTKVGDDAVLFGLPPRHRRGAAPATRQALPESPAPYAASVQFSDVQARPTEFLDLTSLTLDELEQLIPPFEDAFQAHMARWRLDGKPRTSRRFSVYKNCPLPTPQDRLFFLLTYLKTYSLQVVQGRLFGMGQSKANQWIHALLPALQAALHSLGDTPARSLSALAQKLGSRKRTRPGWRHQRHKPLKR